MSDEHGVLRVEVGREAVFDVAKALAENLEFDMPIDCSAVDWFQRREPRFDVTWVVYSLKHGIRVRLVTRAGEDDDAFVPSLTPLWPGMNWHEREAWDMYGVRFDGHPNLRRVLMYDEFVGYPLRKDYPIDRRQPLIEERMTNDVPTQRHPPADFLNEP